MGPSGRCLAQSWTACKLSEANVGSDKEVRSQVGAHHGDRRTNPHNHWKTIGFSTILPFRGSLEAPQEGPGRVPGEHLRPDLSGNPLGTPRRALWELSWAAIGLFLEPSWPSRRPSWGFLGAARSASKHSRLRNGNAHLRNARIPHALIMGETSAEINRITGKP